MVDEEWEAIEEYATKSGMDTNHFMETWPNSWKLTSGWLKSLSRT